MNDGSYRKPAKHESVWLKIGDSIDLGLIDAAAAAAIGLPSGPIRLAEGLPGPKGYGLAHIAQDRARLLKDIGFESVQAAFVDVATNWEFAIKANEDNKVILVKNCRARYVRIVVQVFDAPDGSRYWSATTIIVGRRVKPDEIVYKRK